jgi:hypothetical protein
MQHLTARMILSGSAVQVKGFGLALCSTTKRLIAACRSTTETKTPRLNRRLVSFDGFVANYNHLRYHESIHNLIPADAYLGRRQTVLLERERIKRKTIVNRRLLHRTQAA